MGTEGYGCHEKLTQRPETINLTLTEFPSPEFGGEHYRLQPHLVVREFHYFPCFPVGDRLVGFEALGKGSDGSLHEIVLPPKGVFVGHDFRVVEVTMGDDPSRGPRRTVVGHHGSFRGIAVGLDVVKDAVSLFGSEVRIYLFIFF